MLFTSYLFFAFFALFLGLWTWSRISKLWLVAAASVIFYGAWNPPFVLLLVWSAAIDFYLAQRIEDDRARAKTYVIVSLVSNLGLLGFFKYFNFFADVWVDGAAVLGIGVSPVVVDVILPVGISFYTFQTLAYTLDVYRGDLKPSRHFLTYFCYVSFFPQLVAGPIERAWHLLPQFDRFRTSDKAPKGDWEGGISLIMRGFVKKLVIADNVAPYVDLVFADLAGHSLASIFVATVFFAVQIYCDFSGYTDIARGIGKGLGIDLMENFNYPYFATSIRSFWRRWHISLSTWLRDYLYRSLGGNRRGGLITYRNLLLTMVLGGLWHGAAYNFLLWGAWHGAGLAVHRMWEPRRPEFLKMPKWLGWALTLLFVLGGWFLFRVQSLDDILVVLGKMAGGEAGQHRIPDLGVLAAFAIFSAVTLWEAFVRRARYHHHEMGPRGKLALASGVLVLLYFFAPASDRVFVYFQF